MGLALSMILLLGQGYTYPDCFVAIPEGMPIVIDVESKPPVYLIRRKVADDVISVAITSVKVNTTTGKVQINSYSTDRPRDLSTEAWASSHGFDRYTLIVTEVVTTEGRWVIDTDDMPSVIAKIRDGVAIDVKAKIITNR